MWIRAVTAEVRVIRADEKRAEIARIRADSAVLAAERGFAAECKFYKMIR